MPAARVMRELPLYSFRAISGPVIDQGEGGGDDPEGRDEPGDDDELVVESRRPECFSELGSEKQRGGQEAEAG